MPEFTDHFTRVAGDYASYRPRYPDALFQWLATLTSDRRRAWDCGTGSGQAAVALARHFGEVIGTDPSLAQLRNAADAPGVRYVGMTAERAALADGSVGLVTVAQALHWFDRPTFFREVERVLVPGGTVAVWSYGLLRVAPGIDEIISAFHDGEISQYWPPERALVEVGYSGIEFPFEEEHPPAFRMEAEWTLSHLAGFLSSWSAVGRYRTDRKADPIPDLTRALAAVWGAVECPRRIVWPLFVRVGRTMTKLTRSL
jgi:SAM-dependent methyltransferase